MKILVVGIDRDMARPGSAAILRQRPYYAGWEADMVILATGASERSEPYPGMRVFVSGGSNRSFALLSGLRLACRLASTKRYDVISTQDPWWSGLVGFLVARKGQRLHVQDHSGYFGRRPHDWHERVLKPFAKWLVRRADRVRTVSLRGRRGLEATGVAPDKIDVVPIRTDISRFADVRHVPSSHPRLLCVARLSKEKGLDVLLHAFRTVLDLHHDVTLTIVGDGPERIELGRLCASLHMEHAVRFAGHRNDVDVLLSECDIYVQPSRFEGWGMAVIEAAAAGLPIVMSDVGCAGEVIMNGVSGLIVEPEDPAALARSLTEVMLDPSLAARLGQGARKAVLALPTTEERVRAVRRSFEATAMRF